MAGSQDLNRKIVKSDYASISIPEVDFEIPPLSQKGEVTTVEGILRRTMDGLSQEQPDRQREYPEAYEQIQKFIQKLEDFVNDGKGFSLVTLSTIQTHIRKFFSFNHNSVSVF